MSDHPGQVGRRLGYARGELEAGHAIVFEGLRCPTEFLRRRGDFQMIRLTITAYPQLV
jgi:hypothetical protein